MADFEIRKGVPLPGDDKRHLYPFEQMEVGDSFVVPFNGMAAATLQARIYAAATPWARKLHRKFITRKLPEGIGVWRIE